MSKTAQNNFKPQKISAAAVVDRIKDGTHEPQPKIKGVDSISGAKDIVNLFDKFEKINAKNNCMRVRFYDWLADSLEKTAIKMRERAFNITNPCAISLPPQKEKKAKTLIESLNPDRLKEEPSGMKLPDEEVKKMVPDLTPDVDNIIAVKNATEIANTMVKAEKK